MTPQPVKDYEIWSFRPSDGEHKDCGVCFYHLRNNGNYEYRSKGLFKSLNELLEDKQWEIFSVKRISDGSIFTVDEYTAQGKIKKLHLEYIGEGSHKKMSVHFKSGRAFLLHEVEKLPNQPNNGKIEVKYTQSDMDEAIAKEKAKHTEGIKILWQCIRIEIDKYLKSLKK
jgi:hypothetical protein